MGDPSDIRTSQLHRNTSLISPILTLSKTDKDNGSKILSSSTTGISLITLPPLTSTLATLSLEETLTDKTIEYAKKINGWVYGGVSDTYTHSAHTNKSYYLFDQLPTSGYHAQSMIEVKCTVDPQTAGADWTGFFELKTVWKNISGGNVKVGADQIMTKFSGTGTFFSSSFPISNIGIIFDAGTTTYKLGFTVTDDPGSSYSVKVNIVFQVMTTGNVTISH